MAMTRQAFLSDKQYSDRLTFLLAAYKKNIENFYNFFPANQLGVEQVIANLDCLEQQFIHRYQNASYLNGLLQQLLCSSGRTTPDALSAGDRKRLLDRELEIQGLESELKALIVILKNTAGLEFDLGYAPLPVVVTPQTIMQSSILTKAAYDIHNAMLAAKEDMQLTEEHERNHLVSQAKQERPKRLLTLKNSSPILLSDFARKNNLRTENFKIYHKIQANYRQLRVENRSMQFFSEKVLCSMVNALKKFEDLLRLLNKQTIDVYLSELKTSHQLCLNAYSELKSMVDSVNKVNADYSSVYLTYVEKLNDFVKWMKVHFPTNANDVKREAFLNKQEEIALILYKFRNALDYDDVSIESPDAFKAQLLPYDDLCKEKFVQLLQAQQDYESELAFDAANTSVDTVIDQTENNNDFSPLAKSASSGTIAGVTPSPLFAQVSPVGQQASPTRQSPSRLDLSGLCAAEAVPPATPSFCHTETQRFYNRPPKAPKNLSETDLFNAA